MAQASRTKDTAPFDAGRMTVQVKRPVIGGPYASVWGTRRDHGRDHFVAQQSPTEPIDVEYTVTVDNGMLRELERRANTNKSRHAQRDCAEAYRGQSATVDRTVVPGLVADAANRKGLVSLSGPLRCKVKLLGMLEPFEPLCGHCGKAFGDHEQTEVQSAGYGAPWTAYWCREEPKPDGA